MMDAIEIEKYSKALYMAWLTRQVIEPLRLTEPNIDIKDAYNIARGFVAHRVQAGETIVGKKIGVTSKPIQDALGVYQPDFGQLTSGMICTQEQGVDLDPLIQPKAEAELAFVLERDLIGPHVSMADVIRATAYVTPCFEIVDSRIRDWNILIQDTVADNASCGVFVLGNTKTNPRKVDLTLAGMVVHKNDTLASTSVGASVQGCPANSVAWLANTLGELGLPFLAGEIILSGSQSPLMTVTDGDHLQCTIAGVGSCSSRFFSSRKAP